MQTFTMTEEHVKLLRAACVDWWSMEYGAPCIEPKRPYGNSNVVSDIADILGIKWKRDEEDDYMPIALCERLGELHKETQTALQIILTTGSFEPGDYVAGDYDRNWRPV